MDLRAKKSCGKVNRRSRAHHRCRDRRHGHILSECLIEQRKFDEAAKLLETIDVDAVVPLTGSKGWLAALELSKAKIAFSRGDFGAARKHLALASPVFLRRTPKPINGTLSSNWLRL